MIKLSFERDDVFNLDFKELELSDISLSKTKRAQVLSHLYLYREIVLSKFSEEMEIDIKSIKEFIQLLIQSLTIRGYYRKDIFRISTYYKFPEVKPGRLTPKRKAIIGLLANSKKIMLEDISEIVILSQKEVIDELKFLISRGLFIGHIKDSEVTIEWVWKPSEKAKISLEDTFVVGICMMLRNANLTKVTDLTGFSREEVLEKLANLMLYRKLEAVFTVQSHFLGTSDIIVNISKYHIAPKTLPLSALQGIEKDIVGYTILRKQPTIKELFEFTGKDKKDILKNLAVLTARGTFQVVFADSNQITPVVIPEIMPKRTIEDMATLSFFNYEALFGLLSTEERLPLKKLAVLMNRSIGEVLEGVITLQLEGFVSCSLRGSTLFIESIRRYSRAQEGTLERWEKILLGMVIAKRVITVKDIAAALGVDKFYAKERLYGFFGKGLIKGGISGNKLEPDEIPIFPPLVQLDDLPIHFQEIFGYIVANRRVTISNIEKIWSKSNIAAKNIVFELTGSGLMNIDLKGNNIQVLSYQKFLPNRDLEELGESYLQVVNEIEKSRKKKARLSLISSDLSLLEHDVFRIICQLLAHGYYRGILSPVYFEKKSVLILPSRKMHCLNCGHLIKSANEPCSNCDQLPSKCSVCQGLIKRGDTVLECPDCSNVAHDEHMVQWMKIKEECPVCKTRISKRTLKAYVS